MLLNIFQNYTGVLESLFNKVAGLRPASLLKTDCNTGVFLWIFKKKTLKKPFKQNSSGRLLLYWSCTLLRFPMNLFLLFVLIKQKRTCESNIQFIQTRAIKPNSFSKHMKENILLIFQIILTVNKILWTLSLLKNNDLFLISKIETNPEAKQKQIQIIFILTYYFSNFTLKHSPNILNAIYTFIVKTKTLYVII